MCGHPRNLADWQLRELADCGGIAGLNFCTQFLTDRLADPTRDDVLRHVDHVLETAGEDVLALGSDYDGCDVPSWLEPCDRIGALHELLACEFGRDIADKVFFRNARDFFERVESVGAQRRSRRIPCGDSWKSHGWRRARSFDCASCGRSAQDDRLLRSRSLRMTSRQRVTGSGMMVS